MVALPAHHLTKLFLLLDNYVKPVINVMSNNNRYLGKIVDVNGKSNYTKE